MTNKEDTNAFLSLKASFLNKSSILNKQVRIYRKFDKKSLASPFLPSFEFPSHLWKINAIYSIKSRSSETTSSSVFWRDPALTKDQIEDLSQRLFLPGANIASVEGSEGSHLVHRLGASLLVIEGWNQEVKLRLSICLIHLSDGTHNSGQIEGKSWDRVCTNRFRPRTTDTLRFEWGILWGDFLALRAFQRDGIHHPAHWRDFDPWKGGDAQINPKSHKVSLVMRSCMEINLQPSQHSIYPLYYPNPYP